MNGIKGLRVKIFFTPLSVWRYRIIHVKKKKVSFVCSKICTRKLEQSTVDQTTADISVNTAFKNCSQRKKSNFDSWLREIPGKGRNYAQPPNNQTPIHCIWKLFCHHFTAPAEVVHGPFEALALFEGYYFKHFSTGNCMELAIMELECSVENVTLKSFSSVHFLFERNRKQMEQGGPTCHRRTPQALANTFLPRTYRGVTKSL